MAAGSSYSPFAAFCFLMNAWLEPRWGCDFSFSCKIPYCRLKFSLNFRMELFLPSFPFKMNKLFHDLSHTTPSWTSSFHGAPWKSSWHDSGDGDGRYVIILRKLSIHRKSTGSPRTKNKVPTVDAKNSIKPPGMRKKNINNRRIYQPQLVRRIVLPSILKIPLEHEGLKWSKPISISNWAPEPFRLRSRRVEIPEFPRWWDPNELLGTSTPP